MGVQYIFAVETNKRCNSDWIYMKRSIEKFCPKLDEKIKLSVVYMDGKMKFNRKEREAENFKAKKQIDFVKKSDLLKKSIKPSQAIYSVSLVRWDYINELRKRACKTFDKKVIQARFI